MSNRCTHCRMPTDAQGNCPYCLVPPSWSNGMLQQSSAVPGMPLVGPLAPDSTRVRELEKECETWKKRAERMGDHAEHMDEVNKSLRAELDRAKRVVEAARIFVEHVGDHMDWRTHDATGASGPNLLVALAAYDQAAQGGKGET